MEKRAHERIPSNIKIEYYLWNPLFWKKLYSGTIENLSEKGLYISSKTVNFPLDALLEIFIPSDNGVLELPAKVSNIAWRNVLTDNTCDGIGVELNDPPVKYREFVKGIKHCRV